MSYDFIRFISSTFTDDLFLVQPQDNGNSKREFSGGLFYDEDFDAGIIGLAAFLRVDLVSGYHCDCVLPECGCQRIRRPTSALYVASVNRA